MTVFGQLCDAKKAQMVIWLYETVLSPYHEKKMKFCDILIHVIGTVE